MGMIGLFGGTLMLGAAMLTEVKCPIDGNFEYVPSVSDEFMGTELDAAKWMDWCWTFKGRRGVFVFAADNVAVRDGELRLTARLARADEQSAEVRQQGGARFATALVKAKAKTFYGYYECRSKTMNACVCNAFWLYDPLSDNLQAKFRPGETTEEIDIYEIFGKDGVTPVEPVSRKYFNTVHRLATPYLEAMVNGDAMKLPKKSNKLKVDFDFWTDYHVHGFLWTEKELVWYLDGKEVFRRENDFFHRPLHVTLDCEIMKTWAGLPAEDDLPAEYSIDYVRYWRCK